MTSPHSSTAAPEGVGARPPIAARGLQWLVPILAIAVIALVALKSAWVSDDCFITLRTIDNWVHGRGLCWNAGERVQTYTHPLWLMVMTPIYGLVRSGYFTVIIASLLVTTAAAAIFAFGLARSWPAVVLGTLAMVGSRGFVDYSTSGLENPLTHLLLFAFLAVFLRRPEISPRRTALLGLVAGLCALNRLDMILLVAPALTWQVWRSPRRGAALRALALGLSPLVAWFVFALVYYGFPLPNTYYAKVQTGLSVPFLWSHGAAYLLDAARNDRLSLLLPLATLGAAIAGGGGRAWAVAAGIALDFAYIVHVGGDFMSGRFLTPPFVMSLGLLACMEMPWNEPRHPAVAWTAAALLLVGLTLPRPPLLPDPAGYGTEHVETLIDMSGISDERGYYWPTSSLAGAHVRQLMPSHYWAASGLADGRRGVKVSVQGSVGFYGYFAGSRVHVVDLMALCDPLLARLPAAVARPRIGHYQRRVPPGYLATLESGRDQFADRRLAEYAGHLREIVSGPVFGAARWRSLVAMNLGRYNGLLERAAYGPAAPQSVAATPVAGERAEVWAAAGGVSVPPPGVLLRLDGARHRARLRLRLPVRGQVHVTLLAGGAEAANLLTIATTPAVDSGWVAFAAPPAAAAAGYDGIRVEMPYAFEEPRLAGLSLEGAHVSAAADVRDRTLGPDDLWIPLPAGERLETIRVTTGAGEAVSATVQAPGAAPVTWLLDASNARPVGSGEHTLELASTPLAVGADRLLLRPATPNGRATVHAVGIVTSALPIR